MLQVREYYRPNRLEEALALLFQDDPVTVPLAGGTDLLARSGGPPVAVVDLRQLHLDGVTVEGRDVVLGAMVSLETLATHDVTRRFGGGILVQAARAAAPRTLRRSATLGGTLAGHKGGDEIPTALLALDARVALRCPEPQELDLVGYWSLLEQGTRHLVTHVILPGAAAIRKGGWAQVSRTPADRAVVCAASVWVDDPPGARIALGGAHRRPVRVVTVERRLEGGPLTPAAVAAAVAEAPECAATCGDFRGSATYRSWVAPVLVRRSLELCLQEEVAAR